MALLTEEVIAYFSMEIALQSDMPSYSGGLGVLAGDTVRTAADLEIPMVAVTLLHRKGYFNQKLNPDGTQVESPSEWRVEDFLEEQRSRIAVNIEGRTVYVRAWLYLVKGVTGFTVPVYFLDTDLPENSEWDRSLTHFLYGKDQRYRLSQEIILGVGGVRMLRMRRHTNIRRFHMNEGHASLLTWELIQERLGAGQARALTQEDIHALREKCIFTTHTPVPAGHDQFPMTLVSQVISEQAAQILSVVVKDPEKLNMTRLGMNLSHFINAVARKHGEVSRKMFPEHKIDYITNGVHAASWTADSFQKLYDRYIPDWRKDNLLFREVKKIPRAEIWNAHQAAKLELINYIRKETGVEWSTDVFTLGFARRSVAYKRADLFFENTERLKAIIGKHPVQIVFAGKAHPQDTAGKELIKNIHRARAALEPQVKVVYLEDYDMNIGRLMTSGVDIWLNNPERPLEASGTSGMKSALNGVPSLSVLDGWWCEGCIEGVTGWAIGENLNETNQNREEDSQSLYNKLENKILPLYYQNRDQYMALMAQVIALNGTAFNTQRMLYQYALKAYFL